jgi:hypothetical protein
VAWGVCAQMKRGDSFVLEVFLVRWVSAGKGGRRQSRLEGVVVCEGSVCRG